MKINWKVRFKNPQFLIQVLISVAAPVAAYTGLTASDITSWSTLFGVIFDAVKNPYVLGLVFFSLMHAINDPTTDGLSDSKQSLRYEYPKKDVR